LAIYKTFALTYIKPQMTKQGIVFFDGHCNLCNASVNFIIDRDHKSKMRFASLQSQVAGELLAGLLTNGQRPDSIALLLGGKLYWKSSAALRIAGLMSGAWPLLKVFLVIPPVLRDYVYDFIARNRYKWFGREEACRMPSPELKSRFL
jgi:predicted DCC family thiol-disulfide oxidoreductase YuxK